MFERWALPMLPSPTMPSLTVSIETVRLASQKAPVNTDKVTGFGIAESHRHGK
jgi:hypothetical protein